VAFAKILCPVDFSEFSRLALAHAVALARWYGARVVALHVFARWVPPASLASYPGWMTQVPEAKAAIDAELRELLEPYAAEGIEIPLETCEGDPASEIRRYAEEIGADLIVLGTHGLGGFDRLALGSVTEKVLRKASCPVLTIPPTTDPFRTARQVRYGRILCPVDFSDESRQALALAVSLSRHAGAGLTLLHVVEGVDDAEPPGAGSSARMDAGALDRAARESLHALAAAYGDAGIDEVVARGKPYRMILAAALERDADLIVMGVRGRGAVDLTLFGSTTNQVVRKATCPVLTLRRPAGPAAT
jgi:nucleotide-binding universal stress UspA family protein